MSYFLFADTQIRPPSSDENAQLIKQRFDVMPPSSFGQRTFEKLQKRCSRKLLQKRCFNLLSFCISVLFQFCPFLSVAFCLSGWLSGGVLSDSLTDGAQQNLHFLLLSFKLQLPQAFCRTTSPRASLGPSVGSYRCAPTRCTAGAVLLLHPDEPDCCPQHQHQGVEWCSVMADDSLDAVINFINY